MKRNKSPIAFGSQFVPDYDESHALTNLEDAIPARMARITEIFLRIGTVAYAQKLGFRVMDFRILNVLVGNEALSLADISRRARVDKAWISRLVRELEKKHLVAREQDSDDARITLVSLTERGRQLQGKILPMVAIHEQQALDGIDRSEFVGKLDRFEHNAMSLLAALEGQDKHSRPRASKNQPPEYSVSGRSGSARRKAADRPLRPRAR